MLRNEGLDVNMDCGGGNRPLHYALQDSLTPLTEGARAQPRCRLQVQGLVHVHPPRISARLVGRPHAREGLVSEAAGRRSGLQENALVNVVRHGGHTTTRTLERLAAALEVDVCELLMTRAQRADRRERQHDGAGLA